LRRSTSQTPQSVGELKRVLLFERSSSSVPAMMSVAKAPLRSVNFRAE
jgi:hypothetical protein